MFPVVPPLITAEAATGLRTPLAKITVGAGMLLMIVLFNTADQSVRRYFETDPVFKNEFLFRFSHSLISSMFEYTTNWLGIASPQGKRKWNYSILRVAIRSRLPDSRSLRGMIIFVPFFTPGGMMM